MTSHRKRALEIAKRIATEFNADEARTNALLMVPQNADVSIAIDCDRAFVEVVMMVLMDPPKEDPKEEEAVP
jgi:hypothetical protein